MTMTTVSMMTLTTRPVDDDDNGVDDDNDNGVDDDNDNGTNGNETDTNSY